MYNKSHAIAIRKIRFSESSLVVTWLTSGHGKVKTLARGALRAKSPMRGMIDLFHRAAITWKPARRSDLHTLTEASLLQAFVPHAPAHLTIGLAAYFAALTNLVTQPGEPVPRVHALLERGLDHLQGHAASVRALLHFERELCRELGVWDASASTKPEDALRLYGGCLPAGREALLHDLEIL